MREAGRRRKDAVQLSQAFSHPVKSLDLGLDHHLLYAARQSLVEYVSLSRLLHLHPQELVEEVEPGQPVGPVTPPSCRLHTESQTACHTSN